jgi:predicted TIM-barrel fold metal-dependent hydrolase
MVIDFRIRPPLKSFRQMSIYTETEWVEGLFGFCGALPPSARKRSMTMLRKELAQAEITHGVLWGRVVADPKQSVDSQDVADIVREENGFFSGFGGICLQNAPSDNVKEVERVLVDLKLRGITLEPGFGPPLIKADDRRLYPVYERCQELGGILAMTVSGVAGADISYSHPSTVDRIAGDFPDLKIVVSHACWPWTTLACGVAHHRPNLYLMPDLYGMNAPGYMHYVEAANSFLGDRMLFATAYPLSDVVATVEAYKQLPFKEGVLEKFLYGNAARLLGLEA